MDAESIVRNIYAVPPNFQAARARRVAKAQKREDTLASKIAKLPPDILAQLATLLSSE